MAEHELDYADKAVIEAAVKDLTTRGFHNAARLLGAVPQMHEALVFYEKNARLARLIHSEGDAGRNAIASDGGSVARVALHRVGGGDG